jgi:preprotein translocase subunit SecG
MMIGMGVFWLVIILGLAWLVRAERQPKTASENGLAILDRRLAESAISLDEY